MTFRPAWEQRANTLGLDDRIAVLEGADARLEIWPAQGFNAYRWNVAGAELLYASPALFEEARPTRSGFPILFPFPNRIRDGVFTWAGQTYRLPTNDPAGKNAIHGFACRHPWRLVDEGADARSAWLTGEFQGSRDAPETLALWPSDYRIRLTYRLLPRGLRVEAVVDNPGNEPLPFGLGYHPYFNLTPFGGEEAMLFARASQFWELKENLPTGRLLPVDGARDLRQGRKMAEAVLDDVLTSLEPAAGVIGRIVHPAQRPSLTLTVAADYRELVVFTPPHREAFCLEPYTCTTDAVNLEQAGVSAGWRVLPPGQSWRGDIEMTIDL